MTYLPEERVWVVLVADHKTLRKGLARLTVSDSFKTRLDMYLSVVRVACNPLDDHDRYLSMPEG